MNPLDEHFEHQLLDHFTYDTRTDDGYGPDHPRVGDRCARSFPNVGQRVFFRIEREPNTGLPYCVFDDRSWNSLLCTFFKNDEGCAIVLLGRPQRLAERRIQAGLRPEHAGVSIPALNPYARKEAD